MTKEQDVIISLIRTAFTGKVETFPSTVDWQKVMDLSADLGVLAVCFSTIESLPANQRPDMDCLMDWLGQVEYMKTENGHQREAAQKLGVILAPAGVQLTLQKGKSVA
jgi:hypothetical protein